METFEIKSQEELEKFKDEYGYYVNGNLEADCSLIIEKRLKVDGYLFIKAGWSIKAGGFIEAGGSIEAGESIEAGGSIEDGESIEGGESIEAGGSIEAGESIKAGGSIEAGWSIEAGESYGISAELSITCKTTLSFGLNAYAGIKTWGEATEEEKTISCGKLIKGNVEYGILKETGKS